MEQVFYLAPLHFDPNDPSGGIVVDELLDAEVPCTRYQSVYGA
jgi:hypothetical protein